MKPLYWSHYSLGRNQSLSDKELVVIHIGAARIETAQLWGNDQGPSFWKYLDRLWVRREMLKDNFIKIWYPLLVYGPDLNGEGDILKS